MTYLIQTWRWLKGFFPPRWWGAPLLFLLLIILAYGNSFQGAFVFDDLGEVLNAGPVRAADGSILWPVAHPTRTLGDLTFLLNRQVGGVSPAGYHGVNLAIHWFVALCLWGILRRFFARLRPQAGAAPSNEWAAVIITAVWSIHPLQTQAVTYIVQRHELGASLFYVAALYGYTRWREGGHPTLWRGWCLGAMVLGMASKEIMVTAPLALLAYEGLVLRTAWSEFRRTVLGFWLILAITPAIAVGLVWLALAIVPVPGGVLSVTATPGAYALTQVGVLMHYLKLVVWPAPLCLDYGWPIVRGAGEVVMPLLVGFVLAGATVYGIVRRRAWAFPPVIALLILLPTSSFMPLPDAAMEHRFYLPSVWMLVGLWGGLGWLADRMGWLNSPRFRWALLIGLVGLLALEIMLTRTRNRDYCDPIRLWRGALEVNPENPRAWFHLARAFRDGGRPKEARLAADGLLALVPDYSSADPADLAERARRDAVERRRIRYFALAHTFLGVLELDRNQPGAALPHLQHAARVHPDPETLYNLAHAQVQLGAWDEARRTCERFLLLEPHHVEGWRLRSRIFRAEGDESGAIQALDRIRRLAPGDRQARYELAWIWLTATNAAIRRPTEALQLAGQLWEESRGQSPKVRELLEAAQKATTGDLKRSGGAVKNISSRP